MAKTGPTPTDTQEFQFKLHCRFKVFDYKNENYCANPCNLIATASRYGLVFYGSNEACFQVLELKTIESANLKDGEVKDYYRRLIPLPSSPDFLSVNCDSTKLAVVVRKNGCPVSVFYDVASFMKEGIVITNEVRLSPNPDVNVVDVSWNPTIPGIFTACKSDGTLGIYEFNQTGIEINELPAEAQVTSICWSPKGKQLAVGDKNGKITQYKPDLKATRAVDGPNLGAVHSIINLQWISNFQFVAIFKSANPDSQALVMVIDAPKAGAISYTNYDDICYSNGATRPPQFYMIFQQLWNVLMVASSNSMEVGVMSFEKDQWIQWLLDDASRAELPLSNDRQDTLPVGMAFDTSSIEPVPFGESTLPPAPYLFLMSHHGLVLCFKVLNLIPGSSTLCSPPEPLPDNTGIKYFTKGSKLEEPSGAHHQQQQIAIENTSEKQQPQSPTVAPVQVQPAVASGNTSIFQFIPTSQIKTDNQITAKKSESLPQMSFSIGKQPSFTFTTSEQPKSVPIDSTLKKSESAIPSVQGQSLFSSKSQPSFFLGGGNLLGSQATTASSQPSLFGNSISFASKSQPNAPTFLTTSTTVNTDKQQSNEKIQIKPTTPPASAKLVTSTKTVSVKQVKPPAAENIPGSQEETDALIAKLVREECEILEAEFKALLHKAHHIKVDLGSEDEIKQMLQRTDSLHEFLKEVTENTASQAAEVHFLKQSVLQAWAWYEEAQSKHVISKDPSVNLLQRFQPLNAASKHQLEDIQHLLHYLESQLSEATAALDERWEAFQDAGRKTLKLKIPTLESVFQTMVKQNGIVQKQKYILKDIARRIHTYRSKAGGSTLLLSLDNVETLENQLELLQLHPHNLMQVQYERVMKKQANMTKNKIEKLRSHLQKQKVSHVAVNKPQLSNSFILQQNSIGQQLGDVRKTLFPEKLTTLLSSPIPLKEEISRNYMPLQSTPKVDSVGLVRSKTMPATSLFFSPVARTDVMSPSSFSFAVPKPSSQTEVKLNIDKKTSFFGQNEQVTTCKSASMFESNESKLITVPTTNKVFVESSGADTSTTPKATSAPIAQSSKIISFIAPTNSATQFSFAGSTPAFSGLNTLNTAIPKQSTAVNSSKPTFIPSSSATEFKFGTAATTTTTATVNPITSTSRPPSSSTFSFASAFAPTTDSANVFTAKGGSLFGSTTITATQPSKTFTTGFLFNTKPSTVISNNTNDISANEKVEISEIVPKIGISTTASTSSGTFGTVNSNIFGPPTGISFNVVSTKVKESEKGESTPTSIPISTTVSKTDGQVKTSLPPASTSQAFSFVSLAPSSNTSAIETKPSIQVGLPESTVEILPATAAEAPALTQTTGAGDEFKTQTSVFGGTITSVTQSVTMSTATEKPEMTMSSSVSDLPKPSATQSTTQDSQSGIFIPSVLTLPSSSPSTIDINASNTITTTVHLPSQAQTPKWQTTGPSLATLSISSTPSTTSGGSIFGSTASTVLTSFDSSKTTTTTTTQITLLETTSSAAPVFGSPVATTTSTSLFGTQTTAAPLFGTQPSSSSVFGSTSFGAKPAFGTAATTTPAAFGTTATTTTASVFGSGPIFRGNSTPFGTVTGFGATSTTTSSIFGQPSTFGSGGSLFSGTPAPNSSIFGGTPASSSGFASSESVFGSTIATSGSSPFGATSNTQSIFGTPNTTQSVFGTPTTPSIFGSPATSPGVFGTSSTTQSIFGTPTVTTQSVFGAPASTPSVFGTPTSSSVFGTPTSSSVFGRPTTTQSVFGSPAASQSSFSFASAAANTTSAFGFPQKPAFSSGFGSTNTTTNANSFSFGNVNLGTTTSNNAFGPTFGQTANPFAAKPSDPKPAFGGGGSMFGKPTTTASPIFGGSSTFGNSSAFGQSPGFGSNPNFGQQSTFGQSNFGSTTFGGSSQPSGAFSSGTGSVAQSGFGFGQQQKSAFGSSPVFGSPPAFGGAPTFGSAPVFGGSPGFGSPTKGFGSNTPAAPGFGSTQQNPTFANLANQNIGFGALAQQSSATSSSTPSFSGGSSFSSWRS